MIRPSDTPLRSRFFGSRDFYRRLLTVAIPIMVQSGITNFVGMLDNIMVGQIGTAQMSGVSIVNQLLFVFNLCCFGGFAGPGIYTAQFYGQGNDDGVRYTFRFKLYIALAISAVGFAVLTLFRDPLIRMYLTRETGGAGAAETYGYACQYLAVMLVHLLPFALTQAYSSTLRGTGETVVPMVSGFAAVLVNLVFNYLLIFGKCGFPELGVAGAAIATVIARLVELAIIVVYTHTHTKKFRFAAGLYRSPRVPARLIREMTVKGAPLLINEALWSSGQALLMQSYSVRGMLVIAAFNIANTLSNVFSAVFISMGEATAILLGHELGSGDPDVRNDANRMAVFTILLCCATGAVLFLLAPLFPEIYKTEADVKALATSFIRIGALCMPIYAYANAAYFTLRSGGKTLITFLSDAGYVWAVSLPAAFLLTRLTGWPIRPIYIFVQLLEFVKCVIGFILVQKGIWVQDLTKTAGVPAGADSPETD